MVLPEYYLPATPMHNLDSRLEMVFNSNLPDSLKKFAIFKMYRDVENQFTGSQLNDATLVFWDKLENVQKLHKPILGPSNLLNISNPVNTPPVNTPPVNSPPVNYPSTQSPPYTDPWVGENKVPGSFNDTTPRASNITLPNFDSTGFSTPYSNTPKNSNINLPK